MSKIDNLKTKASKSGNMTFITSGNDIIDIIDSIPATEVPAEPTYQVWEGLITKSGGDVIFEEFINLNGFELPEMTGAGNDVIFDLSYSVNLIGIVGSYSISGIGIEITGSFGKIDNEGTNQYYISYYRVGVVQTNWTAYVKMIKKL